MEERTTKLPSPGGPIINSRCGLSPPDMDECSFSEFLCQHECVNQPGTYFCSCPPGYILLDDNRSCQGKAVQGGLGGGGVRWGWLEGSPGGLCLGQVAWGRWQEWVLVALRVASCSQDAWPSVL